MTTLLSVKLIIRNDAIKADGNTVVYIRLIYNRKVKVFSSGVLVPAKMWDAKNQKLKRGAYMAESINMLLHSKINNAMKAHYEMQINGIEFSFEKIIKAVNGGGSMIGFKEYATQHLSVRPVDSGTKKVLKNNINHVCDFKKGVRLSEIDVNFLNGFKSFLQQKKLSDNTIISNLTRLKAFLNAAVNDGIIKENPFHKFSIGAYKPKQVYITKNELLLLLEKLPYLSLAKQSVLTQFCFSCFTGLRFSDLIKLNYTMLRQCNDGFYFEFAQQKTKDLVLVPVVGKALQFIDVTKTNGLVFNAITNQAYNRTLKEICNDLNFGKTISSHVARHTFVTIGLQSGMQKEMVGKIAGHRKSSTTDGYAHLQLTDLFSEMQKFM